MIFKYRQKIFDLIIVTLLNTKADELAYTTLYAEIAQSGFHPSHTDFSDHLREMVQDKFLSKANRRSNTIYTLTKRARTAWRLGILGVDENNNRKKLRRLCQFLILCHHVYQGQLISEVKLDEVLHSLGSTRQKLKLKSRVRTNGSNFSEVNYWPLCGVILRMVELDDTNYGADKERRCYYYKEEGFSLEQVSSLLDGIREYPLFVGDFQYNEAHIEEAIKRLLEVGYLVAARSNYDRKIWYRVPCQLDNPIAYQTLVDELWHIHSIESSYLKLEGTIRRLTENEKEALTILFGNMGSHRILKDARSSLKSNKLPPREELKKHLELISAIIDHKRKEFNQSYQDILRDNYLFSDMVDKIIVRDYVLKNIGAA
jgi:hypothetical protein